MYDRIWLVSCLLLMVSKLIVVLVVINVVVSFLRNVGDVESHMCAVFCVCSNLTCLGLCTMLMSGMLLVRYSWLSIWFRLEVVVVWMSVW